MDTPQEAARHLVDELGPSIPEQPEQARARHTTFPPHIPPTFKPADFSI